MMGKKSVDIVKAFELVKNGLTVESSNVGELIEAADESELPTIFKTTMETAQENIGSALKLLDAVEIEILACLDEDIKK